MSESCGAAAHVMRVSSLGQARCDAVQAQFRVQQQEAPAKRSIRRDPPPRPAEVPLTDDPMSRRLADEIDFARRLIDQMGDSLSSDPTVIARHVVTLQSVDVVGQMLGHIAAIIRSSDRGETVERIGMSDLRARLQRRGGL